MDLSNLTLEDWLKNPPEKSMKRGGDAFPYSAKYETFKDYVTTKVHNTVTKQAIWHEYKQGKDKDTIIYLNDHGPEHIKTVIERASQLVNNKDICDLNPKEVFFLLNGIQMHDVGNFYGRIGHESKIFDVLNSGLTPLVFDRVDANYIRDIAKVHGGKAKDADGKEDKNTISTIRATVTSDGYEIRSHLLAAILRFADELADDHHRADKKALEEGEMPRGSEIFHAYAACLDTVKIDHKENVVKLHFKIPKTYLTRTFGKIQSDNTIKDQYLLDEIYERTLKMHLERVYCSKFWKKEIDIDKIWVHLEFFSIQEEDSINWEDLFVHSEISYTLHDQEYPGSITNIHAICKDLNLKSGRKLTGENLRKELEPTFKKVHKKALSTKTKKTEIHKIKNTKAVYERKKPTKKISNQKIGAKKKAAKKKLPSKKSSAKKITSKGKS